MVWGERRRASDPGRGRPVGRRAERDGAGAWHALGYRSRRSRRLSRNGGRTAGAFVGYNACIFVSSAAKGGPPGLCSEEEHAALQKQVHDICDENKSKCNPTLDCNTLRFRRQENLNCALARTTLNVKCFDGGDPRHQKELAKAWKAVANCQIEIEKKLCIF